MSVDVSKLTDHSPLCIPCRVVSVCSVWCASSVPLSEASERLTSLHDYEIFGNVIFLIGNKFDCCFG